MKLDGQIVVHQRSCRRPDLVKSRGFWLLLTSKARPDLKEWCPVSDKILSALYRSKIINATFVIIYAHTNYRELSPSSLVYNSKGYKKHRYVAELPTFGRHWKSWVRINENGELFSDFCSSMIICGMLFPQKTTLKGTKQLNRTWRRSLIVFRTIRAPEIRRDNDLVVGLIRLKLASI